jgi:hypothetical protein
MEKIIYDNSTTIYRTKLDLSEFKNEILERCNQVIDSLPNVKSDGYGYFIETNDLNFLGEIKINNVLDQIVQFGINSCIELYKEENKLFNKIDTDSWINVVRAKNPIQVNFNLENNKYHVHTEINKENKSFVPYYTYVYYIQMPDNMEGDDGVLYFLGEDKKEYYILPEEGDLIIMRSDLPHAPNSALNSTLDRMVMAGNVGFSYIKKENSLI